MEVVRGLVSPTPFMESCVRGKVVGLVAGRSVINKAYPVSFYSKKAKFTNLIHKEKACPYYSQKN